MGDIRERRGKLPEQEIESIFKTVSYTPRSGKKETNYSESPPRGKGDYELQDFYRMVEGELGILEDVDEGIKKPKPASLSQ